MNVTNWMSWEGGVDLVAATKSGLAMPNAIFHVARVVHTPLGSAPAGMVLWQPDPNAAPAVMGYVCVDKRIGAYFGPRVFAGTPFESAPVLEGRITVRSDTPNACSSRIEVAGHVFSVTLTKLGALELIARPAGAMPFVQKVLEARAGAVALEVDGVAIAVQVPEIGLSGGYGAVWSPAGVYGR